jgi:hypothetical protein
MAEAVESASEIPSERLSESPSESEVARKSSSLLVGDSDSE